MLAIPAVVFVLLLGLAPSPALDNGLGLTPPMGWLSWLWLGCETDCDKHPNSCLSEDVIKTVADRFTIDGFKDAGYEYIIIDDCWMEKDRQDGKMVPDRKRFKSGMKALADYIHSKGLKFGMYQDIGNATCQGSPGLKAHEKVDIDTFVEWGIDYLKVDGCYEKYQDMNQSYPALGKLMNETGHPILYSCSWPAYVPGKNKDYKAIAKNCNIWRNYGDISASWSSLLSIMDWYGSQPELADYAGPGQFHDPDMLVIGNGDITLAQARVQMAVWSVLAAPLFISADLLKLNIHEKNLLYSDRVIAVDKSSCKMGKRIRSKDDLDIWQRKLTNSSAFAFVNRSPDAKKFVIPFEELGLNNYTEYLISNLFVDFADHEIKASDDDDNLVLYINGTDVQYYEISALK